MIFMKNDKVKDTAAVKKSVAKAASDVSKEVSKTVQSAVAAVKEEIPEVQEKLQPIAEKAKKAAKTAAKKAEPAVKSAEKAIKNAGKQAAAALIPEVFLQVNNQQFVCTDIVDRCKADFKSKHKGVIRSFKIYIKPQDGMAYYVINDIEDKINL